MQKEIKRKATPSGTLVPGNQSQCGIVMPISEIDGLEPEHWSEVLEILQSAIKDAGFQSNLVSASDEISVIQKRIVQNLYSNPIVVCDVSCKNPNVMFELGMRLAFDKPTIIVKDDITDFSFDTGVIEHVGYPRDLRFNKINIFKETLTRKLSATHEANKKGRNSGSFLQSFGEFKVAEIETKEISGQEYIINSINDLKTELQYMRRNQDILRHSTLDMIESSDHSRKYLVPSRGLDLQVRRHLKMLQSELPITESNVSKDDMLQMYAESLVDKYPDIMRHFPTLGAFKTKLAETL
ncbi:hypothetical protein [Lewinella sp. JB7]|uniref:hypothetical protein n=1 Tax=Lewinella sp. JB7 TaxID=2962887 RepID=UPI0020CA1630|nr:hypothetical protein [Lewinella sp. JB7]